MMDQHVSASSPDLAKLSVMVYRALTRANLTYTVDVHLEMENGPLDAGTKASETCQQRHRISHHPSCEIVSHKDRSLETIFASTIFHVTRQNYQLHPSTVRNDLDAVTVESGVRIVCVSSGCRCQVHLSNLQGIATFCTTPLPHIHAGSRSVLSRSWKSYLS
jgi:hypothetical protein